MYRKITRTIPAADMFGVRIPLSIVSLSSLAVGIPEREQMDARRSACCMQLSLPERIACIRLPDMPNNLWKHFSRSVTVITSSYFS